MQRGVYSHSDKLWFKVTTQRSKKKKAERKAAAGTVSVLASCTLSVASYHLLFIMPVLLLSTAKWQLIITVLMKWGLIKHNEIRLYGQEELSCGNTAREQGEGVSEWRLCETDEPLDCALFSLPAPSAPVCPAWAQIHLYYQRSKVSQALTLLQHIPITFSAFLRCFYILKIHEHNML